MPRRDVVIGELSQERERQKLREYLLDLYAYTDLQVITASVATTDATVTTLYTIPTVSGTSISVEAKVLARQTGGTGGTVGDTGNYWRWATYRNVGGTLTLVGSVTAVVTDAEDQAAWDCTFSISGTTVLVRVTGAATRNITWVGRIFVQVY